MTNQPQNTHKNQFSHPGKMVCCAPKLEQFRPNLKLQQICQNWKKPAISTVSAQFWARFQFWSSSFVPNCPNWRESLLFQGLASLEVFRKKTPILTVYERALRLRLRLFVYGNLSFGGGRG